MSLTFDWANRVVESSASILDLPAFHAALRDAEDDPVGMVHPVIHTWKALDLGGGVLFVQADFINGWRLKFPTAGNYVIQGNLNASIVAVAGVYVERKTSAAYATTAVGGSGPTAVDIAAAVWQRGLEASLNAEQVLRVMLATLAGRTGGVGTATEQYLAQDGLTPRVTATFDAAGNRLGVAVNGA